MNYILFYTGLASTPNSIGLKCLTTNEVIHEIETSCPTGKATRAKYEKFKSKLTSIYKSII